MTYHISIFNFFLFLIVYVFNVSALEIKKYVLTGAPGAGKTSILIELEILNESVIRESASDYIIWRQSKGELEPWLNVENFQNGIINLQLQREKYIKNVNNGRIFFDRSLIDSLAYYQKNEVTPPEYYMEELNKIIENKQYYKVFLIENFGECEKTNIRNEQFDEALELEKLQEKNYKNFGFNVIRIKPGSVSERVSDILSYIK